MKRLLANLSGKVLLLLAALTLFTGVSAAWLYSNNSADISDVTGSVAIPVRYFESGNGTATSPFEIATAEQLYNLAWLQYTGRFNKPVDNRIPTTYFYLSADLDMSGWVLPPIGTSTYPFLGNFDGKGNTISNLTVSNTVGGVPPFVNDVPDIVKDGTEDFSDISGVDIIGLFGVVGTRKEIVYAENPNAPWSSYTYDARTNAVKDLYINGITVRTQTGTSLIGLVAGYVNGTVENVGVIDSSIQIVNNAGTLQEMKNLSDYSLIGYCTPPYRDCIYNLNVEEPGGDSGGSGGAGDQWGSSLAMDDLYTRIKDVYDKTSTNASRNYVTEETRVYDLENKKVTISLNWSSATNAAKVAWYHAGGSYYLLLNNSLSSSYLYLYGYSGTASTSNQTTMTVTKDGETKSYKEDARKGYLCYFPINVSSTDYSEVLNTNTGYFIGRGESFYGDLRMNKFGISSISSALTEGTTYIPSEVDAEGNVIKDNLKVYTRNKNTSGFALISDTYNDAGAGGVTGLVRYADARQQLANSLNGQTKITGMEFYGKKTDKLIKAPIVSINGTTYYDYQMPESCIDFHLKTPGYISFFGASTFAQDSSNYFFSLYQIIRNNDNTISSVKEIKEIHKINDNFVYLYEGETRDSSMTDTTLVFDLSWITSPELPAKTVYYFEIPVNAGEYALGSCGENKDEGSCALLYLDIGASGSMDGDPSENEEIISATATEYIYPKGVDFLETDNRTDGISNSASIVIPKNSGVSEAKFEKNGNAITVTPETGTEMYATYVKDGTTVNLPQKPTIQSTVAIKRVTSTSGDRTTVEIYKGESKDSATTLVLKYSYPTQATAPTTTADLTKPGENWSYDLTVTSSGENFDIRIDQFVPDTGVTVTINTFEVDADTSIITVSGTQAATLALRRPTEPTETTEATEPTEATEITEATEATESTQSTESTESTETTEATTEGQRNFWLDIRS